MTEVAAIRLERKEAYNGAFAKFEVWLDNKNVGAISDGDVFQIKMDAGDHSLRLRSRWRRSPSVSFSLNEGETIRFMCRARSFMMLEGQVRANHRIELEMASSQPAGDRRASPGLVPVVAVACTFALFEGFIHDSWILIVVSLGVLVVPPTSRVATLLKRSLHGQVIHAVDLRTTGHRSSDSASGDSD